METPLNIDVATLDQIHLRAFEDVLGRSLQPNQRLTIQVTTADGGQGNGRGSDVLNLLTHFYDGMSDAEVAEIDGVIKARANLSCSLSVVK